MRRTPWPLLAALLTTPLAGLAQTPMTGMTGVPTEHQQAITTRNGTPVATTAPADPDAAPAESGASRSRHARATHQTAQQRFEEANTSHDGHLTEAQAKSAHLRGVATHFAEIDKSHRGYVTFDEILTWRAERKAAREKAEK